MVLCPESKERGRSSHARRVLMGALVLFLLSLLSGRALAQEEAPREGEGAVPSGPGTGVVRPREEPPAGPKIVPPKITKFVNAPYPKEAEEQGLQGSVVLSLTIDKTGKVTKADVAEPLGHGFDEAAQQAAMQFEFEPATRDGVPFAVRIQWRYDFKLTVVEKKPDELKPPTVGNLGGTVFISGVEVALAAAQVVVTGPDGVPHETTTDAKGKWSFEGLPPGKYKVHVASVGGFVPLDAAEEVVAGEATDVKYRLSLEKTKGIEVTVEGERPQREMTRRTIERREMERIPGTSGDALRSIQALPGVARPPGLAGLLIVRGSAPQDTAYFVDGTTVPLIYHFGGLRSTIPTELLDKIDFYPGNFSSKFGQYMGGIVDIGLREPNTRCKGDYGKPTEKDGCFHGLLQADTVDGRFLLQGPIGKHWKFAVGGRRSWLDLLLKPILEEAGAGVTTAPVFYDYQAIADAKPTKTSKLSLRFYGSDDRLKLLISNPVAQEPLVGGGITLGTAWYRAQAVYQTELTRSVDLYAMAAAGKNVFNASVGPIAIDTSLTSIQTRSELGFKIARGFKLHSGLDFLIAPYSLLIRSPPPPRPGEPNPGPFVSRPLQVLEEEKVAFRPAWYIEAELLPTRRSKVVPGFRVDYARDTGHVDLSPRLNARYDLIGGRAEEDRPFEERRLRTTLKGGVGVFAQPPGPFETNAVFGAPGLRSNRAIHYSIGVEQEFTRNIELSLEAFYKDLTNLVARRPSGATYVYDNAGTGRVIGLETLLKYKADARFFGWLTYTLMRSVRRDHPDGLEYLFQYDQTHILQVLGSYRLGRGWEFGARFQLISGPLYTPVPRAPDLSAIYAADAGAYTPLPGAPFSERLPLFHRLDIRVDKGWQFKDWRLSAYLEIINTYNYAARESVTYNYNFTRQTYLTGLPILPTLGLRGEF